MNYRHPELQDRLAAEYVLGGLRAGARQRFITLMRDDAGLRRAVTEWEDRLLPLAMALPPETPPAHVWQAIAARIASGNSRSSHSVTARRRPASSRIKVMKRCRAPARKPPSTYSAARRSCSSGWR